MANARPREFTGKHMLLVVFLFFGTIITVNMIMAYHATQSWTGLVVKNSYVASQHFNEMLAAERVQDALKWNASVRYNNGILSYRLLDENNQPVKAAFAEVEARRPSHEREDRLLTLLPVNGAFEAKYQLAYGAWDIIVSLQSEDGTPYVYRERILVQ